MPDTRQPIAVAVQTALKEYNRNYGTSWDWGTNWSSVDSGFETFIFKYLFPKITETFGIEKNLGNRFNWLAKEVDFIGQLSEEYAFMDMIPIGLNLSKNGMLLLRRNYPRMATKLYAQGEVKKNKITLNNNDMRLNFSTLIDGVNFVLLAFKNVISGFNVAEESEIKAMLVDYANNQLTNPAQKRIVTNMGDLSTGIFEAIQNMQNNSSRYNEANTASGGAVGRYTTQSNLKDLLILTTDRIKTYLLDTKIANTFQIKGIDFMNHVVSFDDLGGSWKLTADVTADAQTVTTLRAYGDYQTDEGDILEEGTVFTFDVSGLTAFAGKVAEVKPVSDLFALITDVKSVRYRRCTKDMIKKPFEDGDRDETTHHFHYYSQKSISPFHNKILITGE